MADKVKLALATILVIAAIGAFYALGDYSLFLRVLGFVILMIVAIGVASRTATGAEVFEFGRGAWLEVRKVVWPSRKETTQTTLVVMVMVLLVGLVIWMFDWVLRELVQLLTGQGG